MSSRFPNHITPEVRVIDLYHEDALNRIWLSDQQRFRQRRPSRWHRFRAWVRSYCPRFTNEGKTKKWR